MKERKGRRTRQTDVNNEEQEEWIQKDQWLEEEKRGREEEREEEEDEAIQQKKWILVLVLPLLPWLVFSSIVLYGIVIYSTRVDHHILTNTVDSLILIEYL